MPRTAFNCLDCGTEKTEENTYIRTMDGNRYYQSVCKKCETERSGRWNKENPDARVLVDCRRRAKHLGIPFSLDRSDITIPAVCPVFGTPMARSTTGRMSDASPSVDRVVPALGYVPGNVVVISMRANRLKSDATPDEMRALADFYAKRAA